MARVTRSSKLKPGSSSTQELQADTPIKSIEVNDDEAQRQQQQAQRQRRRRPKQQKTSQPSQRSRDYKRKKRRETAQKLIQLAHDKGQPLSKAQVLAVRGFLPAQRSQVAFTLQKLVLKQQDEIEALKRDKKRKSSTPQKSPSGNSGGGGSGRRASRRGLA